jgi:CRISPR/Cas system-associated protein Csm6
MGGGGGAARPAIDEIVLLVPGSPEGELAGRVLEAVMKSAEYGKACSPPDVTTYTTPWIADSDAAERLPGILLTAVDHYRHNETDRVIFNATAGAGAMLILIGMLAVRYGFRIYYQHESMGEPMFISQNIDIGRDPRTWAIAS